MPFAFTVLGILMLGADSAKPPQKEYERFEGVWSFAAVVVDGVEQPQPPFATNKIIISRDGNYVVMQGPRITHGKMTLDPVPAPKHFDCVITDGAAQGRKFSAIYELTDDSYKLCASLRRSERPRAFESPAGSGLMLQTLKREKQGVKDALIEVDRQEMSGTWQALTYALSGVAASEDDMKKVQLVIDSAGKTTALNDGKVFLVSTTQIDPTQGPKSIDIAFTEGDIKGKTALGIYRLEPGILTICRVAPGKARPTEFSSKPESGQTLMTYRLMKPGVK